MEQTQTEVQPVPVAPPPPWRRRLVLVAGVAVALAIALLSWLDVRNRIDGTQEELARRLRDMEVENRSSALAAREAQEAVREMLGKIGSIEARITESQSQQFALEALYHELSRNRDEWQLAEIEQVLAIAQQQLQLSGNIRAGLLALQLAEGRMSRADRPQFLVVRRALARDIERLKSVPSVDLPGMSLRLDGLVAAVDALPLAFEERHERPVSAKLEKGPPSGDGFFARFGGDLWNELRQLVVVRRYEGGEPPLLAPAPAYFVRENLKLRLLNARLSLLTRNEAGYREDLRVSQAWIQRYFDARSKPAQAMLAQLKQLASSSLSFESPSIAESLEAVRSFKTRRERGS